MSSVDTASVRGARPLSQGNCEVKCLTPERDLHTSALCSEAGAGKDPLSLCDWCEEILNQH